MPTKKSPKNVFILKGFYDFAYVLGLRKMNAKKKNEYKIDLTSDMLNLL